VVLSGQRLACIKMLSWKQFLEHTKQTADALIRRTEVEEWQERFLLGRENAWHARPQEENAMREEEEVNPRKRKAGEATPS
jgi:hypothetical protein